MTTTVENRIAFARGIAHLLLTHTKRLSAKDRKYIQSVADATTVEQMYAASTAYAASAYAASAYTSYAAYASAAASAAASVSASAYTSYAAASASASVSTAYAASSAASAYATYWTGRACEQAIKVGVPADAVYALRGLFVTE